MTYDNNVGTTGNTSVSAMFDSHAEAQRALERLTAAGISSSQIRMMSGETAGAATTGRAEDDKGFWDSLGDFFFPEEDRYAYAEGLSRGGYLVTVTGLSSTQYETALDILDDEGSVNLDEREQSWRSEGWGGYETSSYATSGTGGAMAGSSLTGASATSAGTGDVATQMEYGAQTGQREIYSDDETIPVVEERIRVGKRETGHGRVRVRAYTIEEPVNASVELRDERVEIERRAVDRPAVADQDYLDRTLEAEEYREEAVVQKEARVVEEIGLRKTSDTHTETVSDTVRRTEVEIEKDNTDLDRDTLAGGTRRDDIDRI
ncbi:YsnF/AvaK domain-containing protein [Paracoccus aerius]|uniref:DUF2382 domain-containing protein n=1 Tax=Paracoccus aerius TaxID=1915382 RepID=A0ABS1S9Q9_9RHOB|nr:DUF2382 domain-containing protein [Paracoccus aerius]MBL3675471.1 DUF2382 domain-containing protein [Paracoccus aerius]GHG34209.1 hypothetical protein GCM10017322_36440 [Paracoccus aerius]